MDAKEVAKLTTAGIGLTCVVVGALLPAAAALIPIGVGAIAAVVVPSSGLALFKKKDANGNSIPPAVIGLLFLSALQSCGGHSYPPQEKIIACLAKMNERLDGGTSCDAIVKAISSVVAEDGACSELLLHGLHCDRVDGG